MITPDFLYKGDRISIVAPAYCMPEETLAGACDTIESWGLVPEYSDLVLDSCRRFDCGMEKYAGTAAERAADLEAAYLSGSKAILCARGGYGTIHLPELLDKGLFRSHPKWLLGFSDITTLHALSLSEGVRSIHCPMCAGLNGEVRDILSGKSAGCVAFRGDHFVEGSAEGVLVGGNMITLAALLGTDKDMLSRNGVILFLEEVGETYHAVDRLMHMIAGSNSFRNVKGIVFGDFTDCVRDLEYCSVTEMLLESAVAYGIPVATGFPAGHGAVNRPFIEGSDVCLTVGGNGDSELKYF